MKPMKEEVSLFGKAEKISMMDFRHHPGLVLDKVQLGMVIIVTKKGKDIAYLSPYEMPPTKPSIASLEAILSKEDENALRILPNGQVVELLEKP